MKAVKTYPKFKCDFCNKKAVHSAMVKHEIICWYNPSRRCRTCWGQGTVCYDNGYTETVEDCKDCERAKICLSNKKAKEEIYGTRN